MENLEALRRRSIEASNSARPLGPLELVRALGQLGITTLSFDLFRCHLQGTPASEALVDLGLSLVGAQINQPLAIQSLLEQPSPSDVAVAMAQRYLAKVDYYHPLACPAAGDARSSEAIFDATASDGQLLFSAARQQVLQEGTLLLFVDSEQSFNRWAVGVVDTSVGRSQAIRCRLLWTNGLADSSLPITRPFNCLAMTGNATQFAAAFSDLTRSLASHEVALHLELPVAHGAEELWAYRVHNGSEELARFQIDGDSEERILRAGTTTDQKIDLSLFRDFKTDGPVTGECKVKCKVLSDGGGGHELAIRLLEVRGHERVFLGHVLQTAHAHNGWMELEGVVPIGTARHFHVEVIMFGLEGSQRVAVRDLSVCAYSRVQRGSEAWPEKGNS